MRCFYSLSMCFFWGGKESTTMLETLKAERIPCKLSEMQTGSVVDCTWKKLSVKVLPSLTVPLMNHGLRMGLISGWLGYYQFQWLTNLSCTFAMALSVIFKQIDREKSEKILDKTYRYASYNSFTFHCLLFAQGWLSKSGGIPQVVLGLPGSGCGTLASVLGAAPNTEAVDCNELLDKDWSQLIFSRFRNLEKLSLTRRLELQFLVMRLKVRRPHSDVSQQDAVQIGEAGDQELERRTEMGLAMHNMLAKGQVHSACSSTKFCMPPMSCMTYYGYMWKGWIQGWKPQDRLG